MFPEISVMRLFLHKSLRFIPILVAIYSISKIRFVDLQVIVRYIVKLFNFSKKGPTTTRALKTKLLFKSFGKSSDRKSVLGSHCCKFLGLWITVCTTKVKFAIAAKYNLDLS